MIHCTLMMEIAQHIDIKFDTTSCIMMLLKRNDYNIILFVIIASAKRSEKYSYKTERDHLVANSKRKPRVGTYKHLP